MRRPAAWPTADEIAERAHELFTSGGRRVTLIPEYWRAAERELVDRAGHRAKAPGRRIADRQPQRGTPR